eukprot:CCRYP_007116-RA/>CCRYP_007116-RA protein AED:0.33 eAED:0.33 QI:0/-1/0/1/-1/1/1/0/570
MNEVTDADDMTESNHDTIFYKKQQLFPAAVKDKQILALQIHEFKSSPSSLRISASQVSALVGLHPYQNLPQLLCDFVYQSYLGQQLLQQDASALGFSLVDAKTHEQEQMIALATAASKETKQLIQQVLEVSSGKRKLQSVDQVQSIQKKIATQAKDAQRAGKMSQRQVELLVEASRGHVSTGFGTCHEEEALDVYEKRVGCTVRERNEDLMEWKFERLVSMEVETGVTAVPMGKAKRRRGWMSFKQKEQQLSENDVESGVKSKSDDVSICKNEGAKSEPSQSIEENSLNSSDKEIIVIDDEEGDQVESQPLKRPFFKIVGCVDGIRDEVYMDTPVATDSVDHSNSNDEISQPTQVEKGEFSDDEVDQAIAVYSTPKNKDSQHKRNCNISSADTENFSDDECEMTLRPIVVECKHRMRKALIPPPLYDQIQTCLYCQMYEVEEADLIQVVRHQNVVESKGKKNETNYSNGTSTDNNKHIEITISRITLDDPIHNHKHHWNVTILPRLASFVDAVYNVRRDDTKRYRLLMALATQQDEDDANAAEEAWKILWDECPWLIHCDTSFGRRRITK